MKLLFFLYFSLASLVPKKAMLGKWYVSFALFYICIYFLSISLVLFVQKLLHFKPENVKLFIILIYGGLGVLLLLLFLIISKPVRLIHLRKKFEKIPKWKLKLIGILYIIVSYVGGMGLLIITNKM